MPYPNDPNSTTGQTGATTRNDTLQSTEDTLRDDARNAVDTARHELDNVAQEAKAQAGALADEAKARLDDAAHQAKTYASDQKDLVAGQIGGVADAMNKVAGELEENNSATASYARMIADSASRISEKIESNDVDSLMHMAQDFGRKQPAAFLGAAALMGFAASRFLSASAKREQERTARAQTPTASTYSGATATPGSTTTYGAGSKPDASSPQSTYPNTGRV